MSFGPTAIYAAMLTKGSHVQIVGEIQTREYVAKDAASKSVAEVRVRRLTHLNKTEKTAREPEGAAE